MRSPPEVVAFSFATSGLAFLLLVAGRRSPSPALAALGPGCVLVEYSFELLRDAWSGTPRGRDPGQRPALELFGALMLLGKNPYVWDMGDAFSAFGASGFFMTPQLDGSATSVLPNPALHFLLLVPVHAFGLDGVRGPLVLCHLVMGTLLFLRAPGAIRPIVLLPLWVSAEYMGFALGFVLGWGLGASPAVHRPGVARLALARRLLRAGMRLQAAAVAAGTVHPGSPADRRARPGRAAADRPCVGVLRGRRGSVHRFQRPVHARRFPRLAVRVLQPLTGHLVYLGVGLASLTQLGVVELPKPFYATASLVVTLSLLLLYTAHFQGFGTRCGSFPGSCCGSRTGACRATSCIGFRCCSRSWSWIRPGRAVRRLTGARGPGPAGAWERVNRLPLRRPDSPRRGGVGRRGSWPLRPHDPTAAVHF